MFVVVLVGCSGSGGGAGAGAPSSSFVSGVAAAGAPIIGNAYLKDSANHVIGPVPIGADGSFLFDVTGLTPPFYLRVDGYVGSPSNSYSLFSVTTSSSGIANINPLTNAIVAAAAGGIDPASVYGDPVAHPVTQANLDKAITDLQTILEAILTANNAQNLNPISSPFVANNTQLDKVFDQITVVVTTSGGTTTVTITNSFTGAVIVQVATESLGTTPPVTDTTIPLVNNIIIGANNLLLNQQAGGGYYWPSVTTDTDLTQHPNTITVTAQGVENAYILNQSNTYLTSLLKTYNLLLSNSEASVNTKVNGYTIANIRGADIYFLVNLSNTTGDQTYANLAKTWYKTTLTNFYGGTATGLATAILNSYANTGSTSGTTSILSAWDLNMPVRGLLALNSFFPNQGFDSDAEAITEVIFNSLYGPSAVVDPSTSQADYYLGITGAIEAFSATGLHLDKRDALLSVLLASQLSNGSFPTVQDQNPVQTTAYAVMALIKANAVPAAKSGVVFLVKRQLPSGMWIEDDGNEYAEIDSEAIQAIYNFQK